MSDLILPGNTIPAHVLTGDTFSAGTNYGAAGSMPNNGGVIITPSTVQQAIALGYHDGTGHVNGDANLIAANINNGVSIFGVAGASPRKQWASGTFTIPSYGTTGVTQAVTGLAFTPNLIYVFDSVASGNAINYEFAAYVGTISGVPAHSNGGNVGVAADNYSISAVAAGTFSVTAKAYSGTTSNRQFYWVATE